MIDRNVQQLLQQAIDTPTKLHLLLLFHEQTLTNITPREMAERVCRDIWSVTQAMAEMAEDGILQVTALPDGDYYRYQPRTEHIEAIRKLIQTYNDPMHRGVLHHSLRDMASYALMRRSSSFLTMPVW